MSKQAKLDVLKTAQTSLSAAEAERSETTNKIAVAQADLTETNAVLNDDRLYLKDLTSKCETKAKEWDQRSSMRSDELSAITQALAVIEGVVATKAVETGVGGRDTMGQQNIEGSTEAGADFMQVQIRRASEPGDADD